MATTWGNPETSSFVRQNLRYARYENTAVHVHKLVWPLVDRVFAALEGAGVSVSAATEVEDPRRNGFRLPGIDPELLTAVLGPAAPLFSYDGTDVLFVGEAADAEKLSKLIEATTAEENIEPDPVPADAPRAAVDGPLPRELAKGEESPTALFLQYLTGAPRTGVFDKATRRHLKWWQRTQGIEATGVLDDKTWETITRERRKWLRPGATGTGVKVIQAAMLTRGYLTTSFEPHEPQTGITGVWGVELSRALRRFQHDHGIHPRLRIGTPEYTAFFGES